MDPKATADFFTFLFPMLLVISAVLLSFLAGFVVGYFYSKSEAFWKRIIERMKMRGIIR